VPGRRSRRLPWSADDGTWTGEIPDAAGVVVLDCAVATDRDEWDNNLAANYRLWLDLDPVDAHVHARVRGLEPMGSTACGWRWPPGG
jgi:hypothetical protein